MKICLISDYFYPHTPGGAEWSVFELAKALKTKKADLFVLTLNYGAKNKETYKGIRIVRMPFYKKLKKKNTVISPFLQNNPFFFLIYAYLITKNIIDQKPDILHVQGKFLIPSAVICSKLFNIPVIVTIRDKQLLCSYGKCFLYGKTYKRCTWQEYLTGDFSWYFKNYVKNKNIISYVFNLLAATWTRLANDSIVFFAKKADKIIAISNSQKTYLTENGFSKVKVIYNIASFQKPSIKIPTTKTVLFVGKLSIGKGAEALMRIVAKNPKINFLFAGSVNIKYKKYKNASFLGQVAHEHLRKLYKKAGVVVVPSVYPEAFGRVALESLSFGTPAVVSDIGALPEIIQNKITGRVIDVQSNQFLRAIEEIIEKQTMYKDNISTEYMNLKKKFYSDPLSSHISLYKSLLK